MRQLYSATSTQQPIVVKYVQPNRSGIQAQNFTRHSIGYVMRGRKCIYYGDRCVDIPQGSLFYLGTGRHYLEDVPEGDKSFEQIVFYYTPAQLSKILNLLSVSYLLHINNKHHCEECDQQHAVFMVGGIIKNFFASVNQYLKEDLFSRNTSAEMLKMTELFYLILIQEDNCLKTKILSNMDQNRESFEQIIQECVFSDISVAELAVKCNRSLTSFKKEFQKRFFDPPHKWFIRQRLMHSRLLLISTDKSIAEIGIECNFPNTSHFIKLFKKDYGYTPADYRSRYAKNELPVDEEPPKNNYNKLAKNKTKESVDR